MKNPDYISAHALCPLPHLIITFFDTGFPIMVVPSEKFAKNFPSSELNSTDKPDLLLLRRAKTLSLNF